MKNTFSYLFLITTVVSCTAVDSKKDIERILEVKLPGCYTEVENPIKQNPHAIAVTELEFPEACFNKFTHAIARQSPAAYCGTTPDINLTMALCSEHDSTFMTINLETRVLHYEKLK